MSPTSRTMQFLKGQGYSPEVVEKWIPMTKAGFRGPLKRKDLFDCIDILCPQGRTLLAIQCTSASGHSSRVKKSKSSAKLKLYINTDNNLFEVWSFALRGGRGRRKIWDKTPRVTQLRINDKDEVVEA